MLYSLLFLISTKRDAPMVLDLNRGGRSAIAGKVITIDPGHPSENGVGTRGKTQTEVEVCWDMAKRVAAVLSRKGARVTITRRSMNEVVTNRRRAEIASEAGSDLSIRLHCDAASGSGFSVYYPNRVGTVHGKSGPSERVLGQSKSFATRFHENLVGELRGSLNNRGLMTERSTAIGAKQGALTGSIYSEVPVFLIEMVVLTNRKDEEWIGKSVNREFYATAIASALEKSFQLR